jgi:hypothetical protein
VNIVLSCPIFFSDNPKVFSACAPSDEHIPLPCQQLPALFANAAQTVPPNVAIPIKNTEADSNVSRQLTNTNLTLR